MEALFGNDKRIQTILEQAGKFRRDEIRTFICGQIGRKRNRTMKLKVGVYMLMLLCMSLMTTNVAGAEYLNNCADDESVGANNNADTVMLDSTYRATFFRFFDEVIDVDEVKNVLYEKFRKGMESETSQRINDGILKKLKENDVVSPALADSEGYELLLITLSESTNSVILHDFFGNNFYTLCCESYMPYFYQAGLSVEDMEYIIARYADSDVKTALHDYRNVTKSAPFGISAKKYIEKCYRLYIKRGYLPTEENVCPELRPDYDKMLKVTGLDKILDELIKQLVPNFDGKKQFTEECREAVICHCMQRYKDTPMCLKLLPDLIGSSAYANYIKGLSMSNQNILTSIQQILDRFTEYKEPKMNELVNSCVNEYCDDYFMVHKYNPFSKPELKLALDVTTPGILSNLLTAEQKNDVTSLKLSGMINAADFRILRAMMGSSKEGKLYNIQGALQHLDLSAVTFAESAEAYLDQPLTGMSYFSQSYTRGSRNPMSNWGVFDLAKMTQKEWEKFQSRASYNILFGDDFKLTFDGTQVHKSFLLKPGIIGKGMFANCVYLKEIKLPENTNKINEYAFSGCNHIQQIVVPENVKRLENRAFSKMKSLQSVRTPRESIIVVERHDNHYDSKESTFRKKSEGMASLFEGSPECRGLVSTLTDEKPVKIDYRYKM